MTDEELRRLKRPDLLELLVTQGKEKEVLQEKLRQAEEALASRRIQLDEAGNIAEAALRVNGVFEAAQAASAQYIETIRSMSQETESRCAQMEEVCKTRLETLEADAQAAAQKLTAESKETAEKLVAEAEVKAQTLETETKARCQELEAATKAKCDQMVAQAEAETREFWNMVSQRLEKFYDEHAGLRELLATDRLKGVIPEHSDE